MLPVVRLACLPFVLLLAACPPRPTGPMVASVSFEGNERGLFSTLPNTDRALQNAMVHEPPSRLGLLFPRYGEPTPLDPAALAEDAWRLEVWYANHGWFDARFLGWELIDHDRADAGITRVRVVGHVEEGPRSLVRSVELRGIDQVQRPTQRRVREAVLLAEGDAYDAAAWRETLDGIRGMLQERSFAHATVTGRVDVFPDEKAVDLVIEIDPGPECRFGPITFTGLSPGRERIVRDYLAFEEGDAFRASKLATSRASLFSLRVFSLVNVLPDLSDPSSPVVPVRIEIREGKTRSLEVGPGFQVEPGQSTLFAEAQWRDDDVASRLWRNEQHTRVGVGALTSTSDVGEDGVVVSKGVPVVDVEGAVTVPHVAGPKWSFSAGGHVELGIEPGYRFFSPEVAPAMTWTGVPRLTVTGGWKLKYNDYFDVTLDDDGLASLDLELPDNYLLMMLFQRVAYDGRNDPLYPSRGVAWKVALGEAGGPFGGNYQFLRAEGDASVYLDPDDVVPWETDTVIAARLGGGVIWPYGDSEGSEVPVAERLYLGGGTTVRGWAADHLGPQVPGDAQPADDDHANWNCIAAKEYADEQGLDTECIPVGGDVKLFGNLEVRQPLPFYPDVSVVAFGDVGRVWDDFDRFELEALQFTVGGGLRYKTPIGPIRLDYGRVLGESDYFSHERAWALHFGLGEAF